MIKLIGLGVSKSTNQLKEALNKYIEESDKTYLLDNLLDLVTEENKEKIINLNLIESLEKSLHNIENINFIVTGNILLDYYFGKNILKEIKKQNRNYEIIEGESILSIAYENVEYNQELKITYINEPHEIRESEDLLIHGIYDEKTAEYLSKRIINKYKKDIEVVYLTNLKNRKYSEVKRVKVSKLKEQKDLGRIATVYIEKEKKNYDDLINIIKILRAPNGCPWDREQTHESIKRELVEECYEVLDAIDEGDNIAMQEEIGDVLLHVVFHGLIAEENNEFNMDDITDGICKKMIFRHPHIFGDEIVNSSEDVVANWDDIKKVEKGYKTVTDEINGIAKGLPSLVRAKKVQKKAAKIGFDFSGVEEAMEGLESEIKELKDVYKSKSMTRIEDELGDVIFSTVNVGRLLNLDCEEVLEKATLKFIKRFSAIEKKALESGKKLNELTVEEMNKLWELVKLEQK